MVGSVPEDTYAATQGLVDQGDQYAATGPQLMSQTSWVPPNYLEKGVSCHDHWKVTISIHGFITPSLLDQKRQLQIIIDIHTCIVNLVSMSGFMVIRDDTYDLLPEYVSFG